MKICHVITRFIAGGAQENTLATVQGLVEKGHQVTLVSGPSQGREGALLDLKNEKVTFAFVEMPNLIRFICPWNDLLAYFKLKKFFRENKFDLIHTHSSKAGILGRLAARQSRKKYKTKVVHTIHGLAFDQYQPFLKNKLYIILEKYAAKFSDAIISVCDAMTKQALAAKIGRAEQYFTVYSGFEIEKFKATKSPIEKSSKIVLTAIGRLFDMKGSLEFVTIIENLYAQGHQNIKGLMVGDGPMRLELEERVAKTLPANTIEFTGLVAPDQIPEYLYQSDLVIHASLREGLARVLPQALACGVPVASYDIGGAAEVVFDNQNGFICEAGDLDLLQEKVSLFITDQNLREKLKVGARKSNLKQFSNATMVNAIEKIYLI